MVKYLGHADSVIKLLRHFFQRGAELTVIPLGGVVVGGMMGAGIEDPRALGAAYGATSSFV